MTQRPDRSQSVIVMRRRPSLAEGAAKPANEAANSLPAPGPKHAEPARHLGGGRPERQAALARLEAMFHGGNTPSPAAATTPHAVYLD